MEINYLEDKKICAIWLTKAEKNDEVLREALNPLYKKNKAQGYITAVYMSGEADLYTSILDLLRCNRKKLAELDIRREKANEKDSNSIYTAV